MDKNQRKWIKRTRPDRIGSEWMKTNKTEKKQRKTDETRYKWIDRYKWMKLLKIDTNG